MDDASQTSRTAAPLKETAARTRATLLDVLRWLLAPLRCLYIYRSAIRRFAIKEIETRYRNTYLGLFWFLITPILYLATFTLVFGYIMPGRAAAWGGLGEGVLPFVLGVFCGLMVFWMYAGVATQAAALIPQNRHLVSEIVFPTEMLAWVVTTTALHGLSIHLLFFLVLHVVAYQTLPWLVVALPVVLLPAVFLATGVAWILAAVGAVVRDVGELVQVCVTGLLFVSAVFYPIDVIPEAYRELFLLNPVARTIQDVRLLLFDGRLPDPLTYLVFLLLSYGVMLLGYRTFKRWQPKFSEHV